MGKKVPYKIARLMYDLQEYCARNFWEKDNPCKGCAAMKKGGMQFICRLLWHPENVGDYKSRH